MPANTISGFERRHGRAVPRFTRSDVHALDGEMDAALAFLSDTLVLAYLKEAAQQEMRVAVRRRCLYLAGELA